MVLSACPDKRKFHVVSQINGRDRSDRGFCLRINAPVPTFDARIVRLPRSGGWLTPPHPCTGFSACHLDFHPDSSDVPAGLAVAPAEIDPNLAWAVPVFADRGDPVVGVGPSVLHCQPGQLGKPACPFPLPAPKRDRRSGPAVDLRVPGESPVFDAFPLPGKNSLSIRGQQLKQPSSTSAPFSRGGEAHAPEVAELLPW